MKYHKYILIKAVYLLQFSFWILLTLSQTTKLKLFTGDKLNIDLSLMAPQQRYPLLF